MRRPRLSTGAWLFCAIVTAALITPAGVYAAVNSHVATGNVGNATTATVNAEHQLLTTTVDPTDIVRVFANVTGAGCHKFYTPPAGKALVLANVTFTFASGIADTELADGSCTHFYDEAATTQTVATERTRIPPDCRWVRSRCIRAATRASSLSAT